DGVGSVYVDGKSLLNLTLPRHSDELMDEVSHFYFGAYNELLHSGKIHATVANVFLYNRPLNETEIDALNANKVTIPPPERKPAKALTTTSQSVDTVTTPVATETKSTVPSPATAGPQQTDQTTLSASSVPSGGAPSTSAEPRPEEPEQAVSRPEETKPAEPESEEPEQAESRPEETKPAEPESEEPEPAREGTADQPTQFSVGIPDAATNNAEGKGQDGLHPQVKGAEAATLSSSL
ncbi:trans-sialidase, putative, partial [Trypanosoma cruzi]